MQLIVILLATVSILTILSGITVFFGSTRGYKVRSLWFLLASVFATIWMLTIAAFLSAKPGSEKAMEWPVRFTFISAVLLDVCFLAYASWRQKFGQIITYVFMIFGAVVSTLIALAPELLYTKITLLPSGNSVTINIGPLYIAYNAFFATVVPAIIIAFLRHYGSSRKNKEKITGDIIMMSSFGLSSVLTLACNLIMPLFGRWDLVWVGPLALAATIIALYYTILCYSEFSLKSLWLKIFSYVVIIASLAIIYMLIFSLIFAAMFRGATPSTEVIILNFVMVVIMLILMPAISNIVVFIRTLISGKPTENKDK